MNIIEIFTQELLSDCCDTHKESERLKAYYDAASPQQQTAINETFIALCGYSFETLLDKEDG